jgi:sterol carrier protein 2
MDKHIETMSEKYEFSTSPAAAQLFGNAGRDYMQKYSILLRKIENKFNLLFIIDVSPDVFAKIAWKNHKHSVNNP